MSGDGTVIPTLQRSVWKGCISALLTLDVFNVDLNVHRRRNLKSRCISINKDILIDWKMVVS